MNKKSVLYLILILIGATLLRLWNLDKPEGMWNDEYLTWKIASARFPVEFFEALKTNCHAPLHYLYLKLWMFIFHDSDKLLRLSSVVPGVLGIAVMFFASLEFRKKDNINTALTTAFLCAISSFLIYFSQEIRIYSLAFFITSLVLLYALKIFNSPSKKNFILYSIFCLLLILTHTIGFVFVFFSTAALWVFAVPQKKGKDFLLFSILGVIILALPFIPLIANILFRNNYFSQWWAPFNLSRTLFLFTDVFSPVLNDTFHIFNKFSDAFYKNGSVNLGYFIFAVIPTIISFICFIRGVLNPKKIHGYMLSVLVCTILTVLIAAMAGKVVFTTKYLVEIIPVFILLVSEGFNSFDSKGFKISIATVYIVISLFYITVMETSAVKLIRTEGQRLPVVAIQNDFGLKKNDKIIFLYYPNEWFYKYVDFKNPNSEPFLKGTNITKYNFEYYLTGADRDTILKEGSFFLQPVFASKENKFFNSRLKNDVFNNLKSGDRLFIVDLRSVSFFPPEVVNTVANDTSIYKTVPLLYLAMSYIKSCTLEKANKELVYVGEKNTGAWNIYVFQKPDLG